LLFFAQIGVFNDMVVIAKQKKKNRSLVFKHKLIFPNLELKLKEATGEEDEGP